MFPKSLYHPHLSLQVKGMESSAPGHQCVFTVGAMKNSRMVSCFAMIVVPLWKFLVMNIIQISDVCTLARQK